MEKGVDYSKYQGCRGYPEVCKGCPFSLEELTYKWKCGKYFYDKERLNGKAGTEETDNSSGE